MCFVQNICCMSGVLQLTKVALLSHKAYDFIVPALVCTIPVHQARAQSEQTLMAKEGPACLQGTARSRAGSGGTGGHPGHRTPPWGWGRTGTCAWTIGAHDWARQGCEELEKDPAVTGGPGGLMWGQRGGSPGGRQGWWCPQGPDTAAGLSTLHLGRWFKPLHLALTQGRTSCHGQRSRRVKQHFSERGRGSPDPRGLQAVLSHSSRCLFFSSFSSISWVQLGGTLYIFMNFRYDIFMQLKLLLRCWPGYFCTLSKGRPAGCPAGELGS